MHMFHNMWEEFFGGSQDRGRNVQIRVEIELKGSCHRYARSQSNLHKKFVATNVKEKVLPIGKHVTIVLVVVGAFLKQNPFNIFMTCPVCRGTGRSGTVKCSDCLGNLFHTSRLIRSSM